MRCHTVATVDRVGTRTTHQSYFMGQNENNTIKIIHKGDIACVRFTHIQKKTLLTNCIYLWL